MDIAEYHCTLTDFTLRTGKKEVTVQMINLIQEVWNGVK